MKGIKVKEHYSRVISDPRTILHNRDPDADIVSNQYDKDAMHFPTIHEFLEFEFVTLSKMSFYRDFNIDRFHCHAIKKINKKVSSAKSYEIVML